MAFDPDREGAILDATLELLGEHGYERMSIDQIARRAGASKATIYRRWSGKAQLVTDLVCQRMHTESQPVPDTGSLRADLLLLCQAYRRAIERKLPVVLGLLPTLVSDPELADTFRQNVPQPSVEHLGAVLERALTRGEIRQPVEPGELHSVLEAVVWHRMLRAGEALDDDFLRAAVDRTLLPLLHAWGAGEGAADATVPA
ncbi:TetR/AcrR family transcriptional regulator [Flindersiella endophytica]